MSFFSRLFKQKQPETLEQKIAGLNDLGQQQLLACLTADQPETYTCAVVSRLDYCPALLDLAVNPQHSQQIRIAARKKIGEHLDGNTLDVTRLSNDVGDQTILLQICGYSSQAGLALVEQISHPELLLEVAQSGSTTQIRQAAAHKISDRHVLEQLYKHAKNKDKSVYKIVKTKLDAFKEQKAVEHEMAEQINAICGQAEQLTKRSVDDIFHARKAQIEKTWADFADQATEQAQNRYHRAMDICRNKLEEIRQREQAEEARKAAAIEAKRDVHGILKSWQAVIAKLYVRAADEEMTADIEQTEALQRKIFAEAEEKGLEAKAEARRADELKATAQALLRQIREHGTLDSLLAELNQASQDAGEEIRKRIQQITAYSKPLTDVEIPEIVHTSRQAVDEWSQQIKQQSQELKAQLRATAELLRRGDWAVSSGHVGRARAILRDLEASTESLGELPNHLAAKLDNLRASIQKLGDWHEFAVTPKKESLVQQMQALIGSELPPPQLADRIHKLQEQWKELCRGGQNQDEALWQEFQLASQQAYEPCKSFFEKQSQEREQNAEQRKVLLNQLNEYHNAYDWENADWKEVEKTLRISREAWQSYWPVPRKDIKVLQNEFDQVMDKLYSKLKTEQERNRLQKQAIVDQAAKLLEHSDVHEAIESAKKLQSQWQKIGLCKRKDDQALWKQFRTHCDAIFEKRSQENEALRGERDQAKVKALALINQLQEFLSLEGEDYFTARADIDQISTEFKTIGELPKNDSKDIFDRYNKVMEELQAKAQQERVALIQQQWRTAFAIADQLRGLELLHLKKKTDPEQLLALQERITSVTKWPGNSRDILTTRLETLPSLNPQDLDNSPQRLRILCIRSEIINGVDTPAEDKALRMQYQVELLQNDGLGQAVSPQGHEMQQLFEAWLAQPGCEDNEYQLLLQRFAHCWKMKLD